MKILKTNSSIKDLISRRKQYIFIFFILFSLQFAYGQTGVIKGHISDSQTNEELIGVSIVLDSSSIGTISDFDGNFILKNVKIGKHFISSSYISYESNVVENINVRNGDTVHLEIKLNSTSIDLQEVTVYAKKNRENESTLLIDQKNSLVVTKSIGASELSKKGIGDVASAVSTIAGISKQEGVKNVFVRGLGDRYNATLLNGLPIPSEDPEYKNISLSFFETDIVKNIGVEKVFSMTNSSDVGGAVININSKELNANKEFGISISAGINSQVINHTFLKPDGVNYFGFANTREPKSGLFDFANHLDLKRTSLPINENYRLLGGKRFMLGNNPLSFYAVASLSSDYSYTKESIKNITTDGTAYQNQQGQKYSGKKSQLTLANLNYESREAYSISYNFLMIHSNLYYVGEYFGKHTEKFQDGTDETGFLKRQQINDNLLLTHQLLSKWKITDRWNLSAAASYNKITGNEPDRRENYLSQREDGTFGLTGSNRQKRFFSQLAENNYNAKIEMDYQLKTANDNPNSKISFGFQTQSSNLKFDAKEYNFSAVSGTLSPDDFSLDALYNSTNFEDSRFSIKEGFPSSYTVFKNNQYAFVSGSYQISKSLSGTAGFRFDWVNINVGYDVPGQKGENSIKTPFYLPNLHLRYDISALHTLRFGFSKTYTLPQSKEISPYQYVNIGFASEGNPKLRYSDNYNIDMKWDYYMSNSELISLSLFYKKIANPIGRVYKGNSAGLLTYENISKSADVVGVEAEVRKNLIKNNTLESVPKNNLSWGMSFSYIFSSAKLNLTNTPNRKTALEGSSPFLINSDLTYQFTKDKLTLSSTLLISYFSDRIYTIGTMGFNDIIEKSVPTLDFALGGKWNKMLGWKFKAGNILNPALKLTRKVQSTGETVTLSSYKKGINLSLGISIDL